jgi:hypothetical protein
LCSTCLAFAKIKQYLLKIRFFPLHNLKLIKSKEKKLLKWFQYLLSQKLWNAPYLGRSQSRQPPELNNFFSCGFGAA